jgi:Na+-transporting methylmalonyl-CoA/oxaloacetate decarboxylase gamma subunit
MSNFTFGWTMMVLGMGITFLTLWLLTIIIALLNKIFPEVEEEPKK